MTASFPQYFLLRLFLLLALLGSAEVSSAVSAGRQDAGATSAPPATIDHRTAASRRERDAKQPTTADVPLLPQPVPLTSIQSILALAHSSACRDAAKAIEEDNIAGGLAMLDQLVSGAFHWRGAVSNGYQQGFFVNALRGYCLERAGDIVKAYRAYQNSRACFDDTVVGMQCPEPRLEVFLGLGRTCLVAGRYTDAFNWLDLVRLEASAEPRIAAAADRALIRRAVEIGDYHDAITNYWDLQALILARGSDLRAGSFSPSAWNANAAVDEESGHGSPAHSNTNPTAEDYTFVRPERILSREEHKELAQLYFWTHQDRPGFKTVLDGITMLGIDNDLGVNDPMVNCFLNNIMRADDVEIQRFYDLLGYAITQARALKGDENYLILLCKLRTLLNKAATFLRNEDDLSKVEARITQVRKALEQIDAVQVYKSRSVSRADRSNYELALGKNTTRPKRLDEQGYVLEDQLMAADLLIKQRDIVGTSHLYEMCERDATGSLASIEYDGTSVRNAIAIIGIYCTQKDAQKQAKKKKLGTAYDTKNVVAQDGSLRAAASRLRKLSMRNENTQKIWARIKELSQAVPLAYPELLTTMTRFARHIAGHKKSNENALLIEIWREHTRRAGYTDYDTTVAILGMLIAGADTHEAFNVILCGMGHSKDKDQEYWFEDSSEQWAWADDMALPLYARMARLFSVRLHLQRGIHISDFLAEYLLRFEETVLPEEQRFRSLRASGCNKEAISVLGKDGVPMTQPGHFFEIAQSWLALGQTNKAFNASLTAYRLRCAYAQQYGHKFFTYAGRDCELLSQLMQGADRATLVMYVNTLENMLHIPLADNNKDRLHAQNELRLAKQLLNHNKERGL